MDKKYKVIEIRCFVDIDMEPTPRGCPMKTDDPRALRVCLECDKCKLEFVEPVPSKVEGSGEGKE